MYLINTVSGEGIKFDYAEFVNQSPREWDDFTTMWLFDGTISDKDTPDRMDTSLIQLLGQDDYKKLLAHTPDKFSNLLDQLGMNHGYVIQPVTKYEHSAVKYFRGSGYGWDYSICGLIFVPIAKIKEYFAIKDFNSNIKQQVLTRFDNELDTFNDFVNGDVFALTYYPNAKDLTNYETISDIYLAQGDCFDEATAIKYANGTFELNTMENWVLAKPVVKTTLVPDIQ